MHMAERRPSARAATRDTASGPDRDTTRDSAGADRDGARDDRPLTPVQAGREGLEQIAELTGKEPEGITGVSPSDDGWLVTVEVVEDRRIPSSTDVLALYEAEINDDGDLVSYRRVRRYSRGRGDGDG
jgi:hypothetical protein